MRVLGPRRALAEAAARRAAALAYRIIPFGTHFQHKVPVHSRSLACGPSLAPAAQIIHFALQTVAIGCAIGPCGALACTLSRRSTADALLACVQPESRGCESHGVTGRRTGDC